MGKKDKKKKKLEEAAKDPAAPDEPAKEEVPVPVSDAKCEPCPVCEHPESKNPTPGKVPAYVTEKRVPLDKETLIGRRGLKKKAGARPVKGAQVYEMDGGLVHRDTLHGKGTGKGAELETYTKGGSHIDAICAHCGMGKDKKDPKKKCDP